MRSAAVLILLAAASPALAFRLEDPLRGGTLGNAVGGAFGPDGWTVTGRADRIWYAVPRLVEGSIEFTLGGVTLDNLLAADNELFAMYEGGHGIEEPIDYNPEFRNNHYKCMLRIYGQAEPGRPGLQKLIWRMCPSGAPGHGECGCGSFLEEPFGGDPNWDGTPQRIRIEWGGGHTRLLRNGVVVVSIDWSDTGLSFGPSELHFSLGTSRPDAVGTAAMPIGAVFSDLVVEGVEGPPATCDGPPPPDAGPPPPDMGAPAPPPGELRPTDDCTVTVAAPDTPDPRGPNLSASSHAEPEEVAYLRFEAPGPARRAVLRLHARDVREASGDGVAVHRVADTGWSEQTLTFSTRPPWDPASLGHTGRTRPDAWYEVDVTPAVRGGPVAFALVGGADGSHFSSRDEGGEVAPRLLYEPAEAAPPRDAGGDEPDAGAWDAFVSRPDAGGDAAVPIRHDGGPVSSDGAAPPGDDGGAPRDDTATGDPVGCACRAARGSGISGSLLLALALCARRPRSERRRRAPSGRTSA